MSLLNSTVQVYGQLKSFFKTIQEGTAPDKFTRQHLKDIGFTSSNHHALIPLLKGLGFLTSDGVPTERYKEYLDKTKSGEVMADSIREAYSDIFVIKAKPTKSDKAAIEGKFKSTYNLSDTAANRAASTFLALLDLADPAHLYREKVVADLSDEGIENPVEPDASFQPLAAGRERRADLQERASLDLRYNIQIHLPATKDIEVYNAIFRSIREHLID